MLANASNTLSIAAPAETRPLAARRNDDLDPTLASGTPETGAQFLSLPPGPPSKDQAQSERRSPPHSHTDATTRK